MTKSSRDPNSRGLGDPILLTPGPLTTSLATKRAMLHDWGSRGQEMAAMTARVRDRLLSCVGAGQNYECVPIQGSGTYAMEAAIGCLVPRDGRLLIMVNGAYGRRMASICDVLGVDHVVDESPEDEAINVEALRGCLEQDRAITDVAVVHCETTTGVLNPLAEISKIVSARGKRLMIDAMSSFGALEIDSWIMPFDALVAASGKCLEGVPGVSFVILRRDWLENSGGIARSLSFDLYDQWRYMLRTGQWRFTPPTHVVAALDHALGELETEGGVVARGARYKRNCDVLVRGMRALGFQTLLAESVQAPIIVTFLPPNQATWKFEAFYNGLQRRNYVIYPGKLTKMESFRVGCIGNLGEAEILGFLAAARQTLDDMGCEPAAGAELE